MRLSENYHVVSLSPIKILITHTDLDGVGCEILFRRKFENENIKVLQANYNDIDDVILKVEKNYPNAEFYITDLYVSEEMMRHLSENRNFVMLVDHHKTSENLNKFYKVFRNENICATKIFYEFLLKTIRNNFEKSKLEEFSQLVELVNDYDLWIHKNLDSKKINDLYYLIGREKFVERFLKNPIPVLNDNEKLILEIDSGKKNKYFEESLSKIKALNDDIGYVFAENYISELANYLLRFTIFKYIMVINMRHKTISIRSLGDNDCTTIAKLFGGGGHKNASGFTIDDKQIDEFLSFIKDNL